jgi:thermitase
LRRDLLAALSLALLLAAPASALKTEVYGYTAAADGGRPIVVTKGQAILRLSTGTAPSSLDASLGALGASRGGDLGGGWLVVNWTDAALVSQKLASLKNLPGVVSAEPSHVYSIGRVPGDPLVNAQYALQQVDAYGAWDFDIGSSTRVTVAVVDAGIDGTQPDLSAKLTNTTSRIFDQTTGAASLNNPPTAACNHATHVAGVAAASTDNGVQVAGMGWNAQLVSYKVFTDASCNTDCTDKVGSCVANDPAIAGALNQAASDENTAAYGHIVVNMSLGGTGSCSGTVQTAVTNAINKGVVVVAAAGNDGSSVEQPGNCSGVIPVGATDSTNAIAYFSSRGTVLASQGLVAPGVSLLTTDLNSGTASATGTSFSSPMVAGAAALMLSANPSLTPGQVQSYLRSSADDIGQSATLQGAGRLNAYKALRFAVHGSLAGFDGDVKPIAFPNPFRLSVSPAVSFGIPPSLQGGSPAIDIYTMDGRFVRTIQGLTWDGRNTDGNLVASGSYLFRVKTSKGEGRGRFTVIR